MKISKLNFASLFLLIILPLGIMNCAGGQQQQEAVQGEDEGEDEGEDQQGQQDQQDEQGQEDQQDQQDQQEQEQEQENANVLSAEYQNGEGEGEAVNNSTEPEFEATSVAEQPAIDTGTEAAVDEAAAPQENPAAEATYTPGGIVKYATSSVPLFSAKENGQIVGEIHRGDHPLVFEDGGWARTSDGAYLPSHTLTNEPVGRIEPPAVWQ